MVRLVIAAATAALIAAPAENWTPPELSSPAFESHPAISPDAREVLFVRSEPNFTKWRLMWSVCRSGKWQPPVSLPFAAADAAEADPFYAPDGRVYFISTRRAPDKPRDDLDIWSVERTQTGWSEPIRLPAPINSEGAEWFPRVTADGALYFGSDRAGGHGATDIYRATRADGQWSVQNLGAPVSTAGDEYEFEIARDGNFAILMADRGQGGRLYRTERTASGWSPVALMEGRQFQVGPLLSPDGSALLFAQGVPNLSGEIMRLALRDATSWPPRCAP